MLSISEKLCLFQILILFNIFYSTAGDRKSVVKGKSVKISVDLGGRRIIKKKKKLIDTREADSAACVIGSAVTENNFGLGRIVRDDAVTFLKIFFFFQAEDGIRAF